mmetsp:Transcript_22432/g.36688  ORF Transcript_22432/g.36688 Transcript_22432/m.36688 type:complete len:474 (+) Transcript_22432:2-1423(+)
MSNMIEKEAKKKASESGTVTCSDENDDIGAGASDGAKISSPNFMVETDGDEDKVLVSSKENSKEGHVIKEKCKISIESEAQIGQAQMPNISTTEMLPWAYNCAFVAVTNIWNDSYRIIAGSGKINKRRVESPGENSIVDATSRDWHGQSRVWESHPAKYVLTLRRIDGFSRLHASICQLFEVKVKPEDETEITGSEESTQMLAESLSYHGKSKMCSCVEKMSMTLSLSAKQVMKYFKESISRTPFDETKLNESIICLIGWLYSVKTKETKYDIITGPLQWYINEKRNFDLSSFGKSGNEGYPILGRLPKLLFRLEGLEAEIRKLDVIVTDLSRRDDDISREKLSILNKMVSALNREEKQFEEQGHFREMLRECIETMDSCKNAMKISEINDNILSGEDQSDADLEGDDFTWTGKRQKRRYASVRKFRRVSLRSRNETIDNWLTMDDDDIGSTPGEKYNGNDAFVDLEDFLVEG